MRQQTTRTDRRRTAVEYLTPSPSTGAEEVAAAMHAVYGLGDREPRATVKNSDYLKDFFGVSS